MKQSRSSWNTELSRKTTHIKPAHKQINTCLSSPLRVWSPHVPLRPGKQGPWALGLCVETGSCAFLSEPVNPEAWPCLPQWTQTCSNFSCHFGLAVRVSHTTLSGKRDALGSWCCKLQATGIRVHPVVMRLPHSRSGLSICCTSARRLRSKEQTQWRPHPERRTLHGIRIWLRLIILGFLPEIPVLRCVLILGGNSQASIKAVSVEYCLSCPHHSVSTINWLMSHFFLMYPSPHSELKLSVECFEVELRRHELSLGKAPLCLYAPVLFIC